MNIKPIVRGANNCSRQLMSVYDYIQMNQRSNSLYFTDLIYLVHVL